MGELECSNFFKYFTFSWLFLENTTKKSLLERREANEVDKSGRFSRTLKLGTCSTVWLMVRLVSDSLVPLLTWEAAFAVQMNLLEKYTKSFAALTHTENSKNLN